MPQNLKVGGLATFRRMFTDAHPQIGEVVFIGLESVIVKTGIPGITDEINLFVPTNQICQVL
ncbi:MAG: hypothetical protein ISS83_00225 [Candidatus Pacebacteria bacterium]|nr:hypothetical protein [Candidatus Paceibacterota bacterium]